MPVVRTLTYRIISAADGEGGPSLLGIVTRRGPSRETERIIQGQWSAFQATQPEGDHEFIDFLLSKPFGFVQLPNLGMDVVVR